MPEDGSSKEISVVVEKRGGVAERLNFTGCMQRLSAMETSIFAPEVFFFCAKEEDAIKPSSKKRNRKIGMRKIE